MGSASYAIAALTYLVLTLLLIPVQRQSHLARWFMAACSITVLWAAGLAIDAADSATVFNLPTFFIELIHQGAWIVVLLVLGKGMILRGLRWLTAGIWIALLAGGIALPILAALQSLTDPLIALLSRGGLVVSLLGLVLLEQIYRNSSLQVRRQLTYLALGIGGIFVYDLFLYSQAELVRGIDLEVWNARGLVNTALAPLIVLAVRRHPGLGLEIFVSRQVVFYTGAILAMGGYLLIMAIGGYYVRGIGGTWGRVGEVAFLVVAFVTLALLVFSETLRRKARVFIQKHFFRNKYDYRLEWLRFIRTLSSIEETDVGRTSLQAVAQILASPGGALYLADESGKTFAPVAAWPMSLSAIPWTGEFAAQSDLVAFLSSRQWVIDLQEYRSKPSRYGDLQLPDWMKRSPDLRIVMPLLRPKGLAGFMLLYEPPPPFELTYEDRDLLNTVGRHIATQLAQHETDRRLAEARQFEAYNRLTAFMMHDLKNSVAQLKLVVENAEKHKHNPDFIDDAISTITNATDRITKLIEQLRGQGRHKHHTQPVNLNELVREAAGRCAVRKPEPSVEANDGVPVTVQADPEKLVSVMEHVIRNAQDATAGGGSVAVRLRSDNGHALVEVADTGSGMEPQFLRERLFKPFDSTKGSKGMGIGAYQVREYARQLEGDVEVQSTPGSGTIFCIKLPLL